MRKHHLFWAALGLMLWSGESEAMTSFTKEMTCPYDGTKFSTVQQGSGTSYGVTLDLQPYGAIQTPWPLVVCPTDGFVFFKPNFADGELERLRPFVLSDEYQAMRNDPTYARAAWLLDHSGASHWDVTWALVQATWQRRDYAARVVERLPTDIAESTGDREMTARLLQGEFLRQLGRFPEAEQAFSTVLAKVDPFSNPGIIARYELSLVKSGDRLPHKQSEAFKTIENDPDYKQASRVPTLARTSVLRQSFIVQPDGLDFAWIMLKNLVWSDDSRTIYLNSRDGITAIDMRSHRTSSSPSIGCQNCSKEILLAANGLVFAGTRSADAGHLGAPHLVTLDGDSLAVTASHDVEDFLSPAMRSHDGKSIIYDIGSGIERRDLTSDEAQFLGAPPGAFRKGANYWYLKAPAPTGPALAALASEIGKKVSVILWDYETGEKLQELIPGEGQSFAATAAVAFSPDGRHIYVATDVAENGKESRPAQCDLSWWDTQTGQILARQEVEGNHARLSISPDGRYAALACGKAVTLWTAGLEQPVASMTISGKGWFPALAFSPNGKNLAVHTGEAIAVYAVAN